MNLQRAIFAGVVAIVVLFAGYNLFSFFSNQSEIQAQKELRAEKAKDTQRKREAEKDVARQQAGAERKRLQQMEERLAAERRAAQDAKRQKELDEREAKRQEGLVLRKQQDEERLQARFELARTPKHIEGLPEETIEKFNSISARYIRDHPNEFLNVKFSDKTLHSRRSGKRLIREETNSLMLYAAISQDMDILKALIDIGLDINDANKAGYTPLMFAAGYNTPEVVQFLIKKGADISATAKVQNLNALHIAALFNPKPDVIDVLIDARMVIEAKTENNYTPLFLAASDNRNLEVVERLAAKGADKGVYDAKGRTALKIVETRIRGEGDEYVRNSEKDINAIIKRIK